MKLIFAIWVCVTVLYFRHGVCMGSESDGKDCALSEGAKYDEILEKCVTRYQGKCESAWPTDKYQCGTLLGGGKCIGGRCDCGPKERVFSYDRLVEGADFGCWPVRDFGEPCTWGYDHCRRDLRCKRTYKYNGTGNEGICECDGEYDEKQHLCDAATNCYNNGFRDRQRQSVYYDREAKQCKCELGTLCVVYPHDGKRWTSLCPANSTHQPTVFDGNDGAACICNQGLIPDEERRQCVEP